MISQGAVLLALSVLTSCVSSQNIILLGDSLSDNSHGYNATVQFVLRTNQTYPQAPYYQGRWSNGQVWIEVAAQQLGVNLTDYASGGATTGAAPAQVPPLQPPFGGLTLPTTVLSPTIFAQLDSLLLARNNSLSASPYYFIEIGVNDVFSTVFARTNVTAAQVFANIQTVVGRLYNHGARKFVLVGDPTVSTLPAFTQQSVYGFYSNASISRMDTIIMNLNTRIQDLVSSIPSTYRGASATYFDFGAAFMKFVANAPAYGITNIMTACYVTAPNLAGNSQPTSQPIGAAGGQLCSNPDAHLFWDQFHPTRVTHEFIGEAFVQQLGSKLFPGRAPTPAPGPQPLPRLPTLPALGPTASAGK